MRPDVVGLQEVDRGQPRSHGADLTAQVAESLGSRHFRFVPALIGTPGGSWRAATDEDDTTTEPSYGIGLAKRTPFTISTRRNPSRVVIDVRADFATVTRKVWFVDRDRVVPQDRDLPVLQGWRYEVFGKDALELVEGRLGFGVESGRLKMTRIQDPVPGAPTAE